MKNLCGKSHPQQWKVPSMTTKGNQQFKQLLANPKLPKAMTKVNLKFVMGRLMFTVDALKMAGKSCVKHHNYYISNFNKGQDIIVSYKE
jgi:hypothetical protein